ncbi:MAG: hypothetical protein ABIR68_00020 [Ilumatobacteraceae bacterium]
MTHEHNMVEMVEQVEQDETVESHGIAGVDRRRFLRLGGASVALAAILAACNNTEAGKLGRIGLAPSTTKLPTVGTTDVALLRTCSSLQHSLLAVYNKIEDDATLLDPANKPLVARLIADAESAAKVFDGLTTGLGGVPWTCGNSKFDSALINPAIQRITTATPATPEAKAIPASDDMKRDMLTLTHGMESIIAAAYQQYVTLLSTPATRAPVLQVAAANARHAALLALTINTKRPDGYVSSGDQAAAEVAVDTTPDAASTTVQDIGQSTTTVAAGGGNTPTAILAPSAIPGTFGATATLQIVVGAGDENGTRLKLNLETPSVNSFEYEYLTPSC